MAGELNRMDASATIASLRARCTRQREQIEQLEDRCKRVEGVVDGLRDRLDSARPNVDRYLWLRSRIPSLILAKLPIVRGVDILWARPGDEERLDVELDRHIEAGE